MSLSDAQIAHASDLFASIPELTTRKMFGGLGLYSGGIIFAVIMSDGTVRLKGKGGMVERFETLGMERWTTQRPGRKPSHMPYWTLPDAWLDDPDAIGALAQEALEHL